VGRQQQGQQQYNTKLEKKNIAIAQSYDAFADACMSWTSKRCGPSDQMDSPTLRTVKCDPPTIKWTRQPCGQAYGEI